ncbi:MAG: hypothetical protein EHM49_01410 [Deltaproteobacteria bacterium]|nr:MAG: hypothetical protein EHM49_01410 [Deltaproteobacteria bacterium]
MNITDENVITSSSDKKGDLDSTELLTLFDTWLVEAENSLAESSWREVAEEDYDFYAGEQDTDEVKLTLQAQNRPTTTYNEIKPKVDKLVGLADQVRRVPSVLPVGKEDEALAELMNGVFKHFRYTQGLSDKEMDCFEHSTKSGRSFLFYYIDKSNPFEPSIIASRLPGRDVLLDPNSIEYDLSDAKYVFINRWFREEDIKAHWPEFSGSIVKMFQGSNDVYTPSYFDETKKLYRLIEVFYKVPKRVTWFLNPISGKPESLTRAEWIKFKKAIQEGITLPDGRVLNEVPQAFETVKKFVYHAIFSGGVLLEHGPSPYNWEGFPLTLYGAYKNEDENRWFSAISMMKDPQRALNTLRRQLSHLLQTAPKGILMYEVNSILNIDEYDAHSAEPNFRLELSRDAINRVKFTDQPQISNVYSVLDGTFQQSMKDVSGIQDPMMGVQTSSREPGVTARLRLESNIAVLYLLLKNFRRSRVQGGKIFMSLIQQYVTAPMVIRVEGQEGMQLVEINTKLNPQVEGFNDISAGKFDLMIDEEAENTTMRREIAQMLMELAHNNPDSIPPEIILEYLDLPLTAKMKVQQYNQDRINREVELRKMEIESKNKAKSQGEEK